MNQKRLSVSIVIPAYNEERHLTLCLDAIAAQTVRPDEVLVVDNGSSDNTAAIARSYPFVRLIDEPRRGIVFARTAGYSAARSDIIGRIDADTIIPTNWVAHIRTFYAAQQHEHVAWTSPGYFRNVPWPRLSSRLLWLLGFGINRLALGSYPLWGSSMALPKSLWQQLRTKSCEQTTVHEDLDLAMHLVTDLHGSVYFDRHMVVSVLLHAVQPGSQAFWRYLQLWPRTLRLHKHSGWIISEVFGVGLVCCLLPAYIVSHWTWRWASQPPASF